jgi:hypothetical protein
MAKKKKKKRKTLEECDVWTMERANGSWACTIESPNNPIIGVLAFGDSKQDAIEKCKIKWKEHYLDKDK